jgi:predicted PurR-regulated permease PerM
MGLIMGTALTLAFFLLNVPYSLLLGLLVGLMTLIPFGDIVGFGLISLLVAAQDLGLGVKTLAVATIIDQVVDQAIAPRVLGGFTGLRPIWVIISLLIGTKIAGLPGLLTAVPVAGFIQDLIEDRHRSVVESAAPESPPESTIASQAEASRSTVSQDPIQAVTESPSQSFTPS